MNTRPQVRVPTSLAEFVDPATTALVMWDMQKGLAGKAINTTGLQAAARVLLDAAEAAGVLVAWSRHLLPPLELTSGPFLMFLMRKGNLTRQEDLRPSMQPGMEETEFLPGFQPAPHHLVLEKSQPSLFVDTPFDLRLKSRGIRSIVLAGVATDIGIEFTARHGMALGYFPVIAEDATGSYTAENQARSMAFLRRWMPVASAAEIASVWKRS